MRTEARAISLEEISLLVPAKVTDSFPAKRIASPAVPVSRYIVFTGLALGGLLWDLFSKWYVFNWLGAEASTPVWNGSLLGIPVQFDLATTFNRGALWGIGQNQTWIFATLSIIATGVIIYFLWNRQAVESWWLTVSTSLLLAGTLGNLYDRLGLHGWRNQDGLVYAVRDFLDFIFFGGAFHWATFNFADAFLVTGAIMLVIQSFWMTNSPAETPSVS